MLQILQELIRNFKLFCPPLTESDIAARVYLTLLRADDRKDIGCFEEALITIILIVSRLFCSLKVQITPSDLAVWNFLLKREYAKGFCDSDKNYFFADIMICVLRLSMLIRSLRSLNIRCCVSLIFLCLAHNERTVSGDNSISNLFMTKVNIYQYDYKGVYRAIFTHNYFEVVRQLSQDSQPKQ